MADQYLTGRRDWPTTHGPLILSLLAGATLLGSCGRGADGGALRVDSPDVVAVATAPRPGVLFDPATIRVGQRVAGLVVDSMAVVPTADSILVGVVRFRGTAALSGTTIQHFDADASASTECFETDSASAATLPRWVGDARRSWFCFDNRDAARQLLGAPAPGSASTIVIERFTIHFGFSDQVNSASLVSARPAGSM